MANKKRILTDYAIPPGETLKEELEYINMTQKELAIRLGVSPKTINQIIKGEAPITPETAAGLENVLGIDAVFWLNLEANYQADLARLKSMPKEREIELTKKFPYSELAKLRCVPNTRKPLERALNLRKFFGVSSLENVEKLALASNFRRKPTKSSSFYALLAWLRLAEIIAQKQLENVSVFSRKAVLESLESLRTLTYCEEGFDKKIISICAKVGIAVVFLPSIKGTSIQGAAKWIAPDKALIAITSRYKWADIFWFSLFHEIGHLYL
ncbi:HigA family addiction module antitoxin, partial [Thermovirga sp.]|uniref:HigA family addiction module antitoxin n=1 Tax=Thermovirga sp. TaxID=2699834 RepID=UPI0025E10382